MGVRTGITRIACVLKWAAIVWLVLGLCLFFYGLTNKPASELLLIDGLIFGIPAAIGLVLAYIVAGFGTPDAPKTHEEKVAEAKEADAKLSKKERRRIYASLYGDEMFWPKDEKTD